MPVKASTFPETTNNYLLKQYDIIRFYKGQNIPSEIIQIFPMLVKKLKIIVQRSDGEYSQGYVYLQNVVSIFVELYTYASNVGYIVFITVQIQLKF